MLAIFKKAQVFGAITALSLTMGSSALVADTYFNQSCCEPTYNCCEPSYDCCEPSCGNFYLGVFGGWGRSNSTRTTQRGTVFFPPIAGGTLDVDAKGNAKKNSTSFGGFHVGYEWKRPLLGGNDSKFSITPAAEFEAYYYNANKRATVFNPTVRIPEHTFADRFPTQTGVFLANAVIAVNNTYFSMVTPYVGVGIGAAYTSVRSAESLQIDPVELGVNHFNSRTHDSDWKFAAQAKAGLRFSFCQHYRFFAEYRFLYLDSSKYTFGPTVYPTHAETSKWKVKMSDMYYNTFAVGIELAL